MIIQTEGLLTPAAQKFYNAIHHLERFDICNDLFENISYIDAFLSEYRNVTFVIQKSLAHTPFIDDYSRLRDKYLKNELGTWFVEKRNEIIKEHSFELEKQIKIFFYDPLNSHILSSKVFSTKDEATYAELVEALKRHIKSSCKIETHFSIRFIYRETGKDKDLFDLLLSGIKLLHNLLEELNTIVADKSNEYTALIKKINSSPILKVTTNDLLIDDYVYYAKNEEFIRGERTTVILPSARLNIPDILKHIKELPHIESDPDDGSTYSLFIKLTVLHALIYNIQNRFIMPTFLVVYNDNSFGIDTFNSSIRTTAYRKVNEIANLIKSDNNIKAVIHFCEMWRYNTSNIAGTSYQERVKNNKPTPLFASHYIDYKLSKKSIYVDGSQHINVKSLNEQIANSTNAKVYTLFWMPIIYAFSSRMQ